ncbi:MAG: rRNA maturation RNase YbeY [Chitinophagaceae bacterium]|nr:MAG: rRNA maturation RNase YbeY [Chitinophagaceae bacterium]
MAAFQFHYTDQHFHFPKRSELKVFLGQLAKAEGKAVAAINYIFCSDEYLLQINQAHLDHDTYTDIITFPYHTPGAPLESDIYISVDRVRENAASFGVPFQTELYRVMFHGLLHLCGYKDKTKADQTLMRAKEDFWLQRYSGSTWNKR